MISRNFGQFLTPPPPIVSHFATKALVQPSRNHKTLKTVASFMADPFEAILRSNLNVMTFLGGPLLFSLDGAGLGWPPFFLVSMANLATWKQLTKCPTSGGFMTREDRNLWTSSFLHKISLWYRALALMAEKEEQLDFQWKGLWQSCFYIQAKNIFNLICRFDFWLKPIFATAPTASKIDFTSKLVKIDPKIIISLLLTR